MNYLYVYRRTGNSRNRKAKKGGNIRCQNQEISFGETMLKKKRKLFPFLKCCFSVSMQQCVPTAPIFQPKVQQVEDQTHSQLFAQMTFMKLLTVIFRVFSLITGGNNLFMRQGKNQTFVLSLFVLKVLCQKRKDPWIWKTWASQHHSVLVSCQTKIVF